MINNIQLRAEQLVLYSIMMRPDLVHNIMTNVSKSMFLDSLNRGIFEAAVELYVDNEPISLISIYKKIGRLNKTNSDEIKKTTQDIIGQFPIISNLELGDSILYLISEDVKTEHKLVANKIIKMTNSDGYDPADVIVLMHEHIMTNKFKSLTKKKDFSNDDLFNDLEASMKRARESHGVHGIETGYVEYDKITSGMHETNLIIVAARPAMGKTQFALGIMAHACISKGMKGVFFSCEMTEVQIMKRLVSVQGNIEGYSIKRGNLSRNELVSFHRTRDEIVDSGVKILAGSWGIDDIVSKCHELSNSEGLDYAVVDYIQKVHGTKGSNRNNEVEEIAGKLKNIATELRIPIIALSQLSRAVEQRTDKRPMLSDLRDSGSIEQDADIVVFLYRPGYYMEDHEKQDNPLADEGYIMIAKHRDGELRDIRMRFEENIPAWKNPPEFERREIQAEININSNN